MFIEVNKYSMTYKTFNKRFSLLSGLPASRTAWVLPCARMLTNTQRDELLSELTELDRDSEKIVQQQSKLLAHQNIILASVDRDIHHIATRKEERHEREIALPQIESQM